MDNNEIDKLKEENSDLRYELFELKNKRNLDYEYRELINDLLISARDMKNKKKDNYELIEYCDNIIEYIRTFLIDYKL